MAYCSTQHLNSSEIFGKRPGESVGNSFLQNGDLPSSIPSLRKMLEGVNLESFIKQLESTNERIPQNIKRKSPANSSVNLKCEDRNSAGIIESKMKREYSGDFSKEKSNSKSTFQPDPRTIRPRLCVTEYHKHPGSDANSGILQICCHNKESVYHYVDNSVREMEKIIRNPGASICRDIMDNTPELNLPGPYKYHIDPKPVNLNSNRYTLDVLGLFISIIDMIYSCGSVTVVMNGGVRTPLEFSHDVVKIIIVMKAAFPSLFKELQKLMMYSSVTSVMRKIPFKWNKCMVQVLEDLVIHPLDRYVNKESIEFKLLTVIVQKRAKVLFKQLELDSSQLPKISMKYKTLLLTHFSKVYSQEIKEFLARSARNSLRIHLVKNVRYNITDEAFIRTLNSVWSSHNNVNC